MIDKELDEPATALPQKMAVVARTTVVMVQDLSIASGACSLPQRRNLPTDSSRFAGLAGAESGLACGICGVCGKVRFASGRLGGDEGE